MRALALLLALAGVVHAETVTVKLKSGGEVEGSLIRESDSEVVVGLAHGSIRIAKKDVVSLDKKADGPKKQTPAGQRLPGWNRVVEVILAHPKGPELKQVPATVIETGVLERVPYVSHRFGAYELNVYGDPDHPAGYEVGVVAGAGATGDQKKDCQRLVRELLATDADRKAFDALALEPGKRVADGLTFEVTPHTAEDSYGGWWISVYDLAGLDKARASDKELDAITERDGVEDDDPVGWKKDDYKQARPQKPRVAPPPRPAPAVEPPPQQPQVRRVFRRGFYREDGTFVPRRRRRH